MNEKILPAFENNSYAIACSSSVEYAPYLSVYLQSIKEHASKDNTYDVIVFESSWSETLRKKFKTFFNASNFSVRFINPEPFFDGIDLYITHSYFKRECYYRLAAPLILSCYKKIVITDIDIIVLKDIEEIFHINMDFNCVAACTDPIYKHLYDTNRCIAGKNIPEYTDNFLRINPEKYYNTGLLLVDVERYLELDSFNNLIGLIKENYFVYQEQCALNMFFKGKTTTLSSEWNYEADPTIFANFDYYRNYIRPLSDIRVCHFLGRFKPWYYPAKEWSEIWWQYARHTPFYEEILVRMVEFRFKSVFDGVSKIHFVIQHINFFRMKKLVYKIKKCIMVGKDREKYQRKYQIVKKLLNEAKKYRKQLFKV